MYGAITSRTNWTPSQINELTLGQLGAYIHYWSEANSSDYAKKDGSGLLFDDIGTFNESAGISRVKKNV